MLKYILLGSAIAVATPVVAQDAANAPQTAPSTAPMPGSTPMTPTDTTTTATPAADATMSKPDKKMSKGHKAEVTATKAPEAMTQPAPRSAGTMPMEQAPATDATPAQTATDQAMATDPAPPKQSAKAQPQATAGDQVATIVDSEFGTYDKDADGSLSKVEFTAWMDALKAKAPNAATQPADPKWNDAAFAQADSDRSTSVTKQELTGFLAGSARTVAS